MTARDLFTEETNTPREGHDVLKGAKPTSSASTERPDPSSTCGTCDRGHMQPIGFVRCDLLPAWCLTAPRMACQLPVSQWKPITTAAAQATPIQEPAPVASAPHEVHRMRDASMRAIFDLRASGKITERQRELLEFFADRPGQNFTRQEIAREMTQRHGPKWAINQVCGRCRELLDTGRLREIAEHRRCNVTTELVNAIERGVW